ncbi:EXS, C-terminal [Sesbania bispinosa]|nr:EXS, C-terminal [Sesbania bispinosa]
MQTMMVWLWGVNLWVFLQSNVSYAKVFDLDQNHLTHKEIWKCSTWMTIIVPTSMTAYLYLYSHGEVSLAASQPVLLYISAAVILIFPFDIFYLSSRYFFLRTLLRIAFPLQPISFPDFFVADILTSMAKVFSDLERSVCRVVNRQVATIAWLEADSVCGSHSVAIPIVLVLPYIWRLLQCLRQYKDTKEKTCLFNALKYSTAVPLYAKMLSSGMGRDSPRHIVVKASLSSSMKMKKQACICVHMFTVFIHEELQQ